MSHHSIAFRRAWALRQVGAEPRQVELPGLLEPGDAILELVRAFHRPRIELDAELLQLRLARVPGLLAVRLNGQGLGLPDAREPIEIPLEPLDLPWRNVLELEVAPSLLPRPGWGEIALRIRTRPDRLA
jgi:hypothetical protein